MKTIRALTIMVALILVGAGVVGAASDVEFVTVIVDMQVIDNEVWVTAMTPGYGLTADDTWTTASTEFTYLGLAKQGVEVEPGVPEPYWVSKITFSPTASGPYEFSYEIDMADPARSSGWYGWARMRVQVSIDEHGNMALD